MSNTHRSLDLISDELLTTITGGMMSPLPVPGVSGPCLIGTLPSPTQAATGPSLSDQLPPPVTGSSAQLGLGKLGTTSGGPR